MLDRTIQNQLLKGIKDLSIQLDESKIEHLCEYLNLLVKWNKAYNLTAIRNPAEMVTKHLLDSLAILPYLDLSKRLIDVGTGPGLPGIIVAIASPESDITLLDSNGKKTRFLVQVKNTLGLKHVTIVNDRVEAFKPDIPFDIITSRAFASLKDMTFWCAHLLAEDGKFLAMKGLFPQAELDEIAEQFHCSEQHRLHIPDLDEERHLVGLKPI